MKVKSLVNGALFAGLALAAGASVANPVTITFNDVFSGQYDDEFNPIFSRQGIPASVGGYANEASCPTCYAESEFLFGTVTDSDPTNHIHGDLDGPLLNGDQDKSMSYHNDSAGFYFRLADGGAFKLHSLFFDNNDPSNVRNGTWEILGFNTASNNLLAGDGNNYPTRVAYQTVTQGPSPLSPRGEYTVNLNSDFNDADGVNAVWIHWRYAPGGVSTYLGASTAKALPTGFKVNIDDIVVERVASVPAVPVPAAAWLFGSGLLGLLSLRSRKA